MNKIEGYGMMKSCEIAVYTIYLLGDATVINMSSQSSGGMMLTVVSIINVTPKFKWQ